MNERIKELAIKSQLVYDDNGKLLTGWMSHVDLSEELTKFAELIVRECIRNYRLKHLEYIRTGQYVDEYEHANNMLAQLGFEETFRS